MYAILDIECNGAPFHKERITDIAIYRFDGHKVEDQFISLVNPEEDITPYVQKLTGITPKMVRTAPRFHEVARRIIEITDGALLVGHNVAFDYRVLRQSFQELGYDFEKETIDTIPLTKKLIPGKASYSLGKLCKSIGIPVTDRHRAAGDARATVELFKILLAKDRTKEILQKQKDHSEPDPLKKKYYKLTEFLPGEKGLFYFLDAEGQILYSGYAPNIYQMANKIFNSGSKRWDELKNKTVNIEYEYTGTTFIAQLMMQQKAEVKRVAMPFGLFEKDGEFSLERRKGRHSELLRFRKKSQGDKVLQYINRTEAFKEDPNALRRYLSLEGRNEIWIAPGRSHGERSFLTLEKGVLTGYGYFELYHQINTLEKINKLKIKITPPNTEILNELKLSLLSQIYEIKKLPEN